MPEQQIRQIIRDELQALGFLGSDQYLFQKHLKIFDGRNLRLGAGTGTKIGTGTSEKLAFYGVAPVNQPDAIAAPTIGGVSGGDTVNASAISTNFAQNEQAINNLRSRLQELGLIAS